jgi:hypothetical protein
MLTQHATNILINEIERRGELTFAPSPDGLAPTVPCMSDYFVETILTARSWTTVCRSPLLYDWGRRQDKMHH